jgi:hypothetical protein
VLPRGATPFLSALKTLGMQLQFPNVGRLSSVSPSDIGSLCAY